MKVLKSEFSKKLIIIFLIVLFLFNVLYPSMSFAVDIGGILMQPLWWLLLGNLIPADVVLGATIRMIEWSSLDLTQITNQIMDGSCDDSLSTWFIGPDTIFKRSNFIL